MPALAPPVPPASDPYAIFAAAQRYWQSAVYPQKASYDVTVSVSKNDVTSQAHYHAYYDALQDRVRVIPVSDEELAHPYTPHGINFNLSPFGGTVPLSAPQRTFDYLGVPELAPNYSFGIVPNGPMNTQRNDMDVVLEIRKEFHDPLPSRRQQPNPHDLKTIAEVVVAHRQYVITLDGMQMLDGHADYHLLLRPVTDPATYRLREMWVNASTHAVDRLITDGNFTAGELGGVRWQVDYHEIGGAPFIASETSLAGFTLDRRHYDTATVAFEAVNPVKTIPFESFSGLATDPETAPEILSEPAKPRT
jgi:hypothetical protein